MNKAALVIGILLLGLFAHAQTLVKAVYFENDSHELLESEQLNLKSWCASYPITSIELRGFTDSKGNEDYNLALSKRRVESVSEYLVFLGVPLEMQRMDFLGEAAPKADNLTEEGRKMNRRVELVLHYRIEEIPDLPPVEAPIETPSPIVQEQEIRLDNSEINTRLGSLVETQIFDIATERDTVIRSKDGFLFYFEKNSFDLQGQDCRNTVKLTLKEYNDKQSIILGNMQTVSNGNRLYSVGMYEMKATCNDTPIDLKEGKNYTALAPIPKGERKLSSVKGFIGTRDPITQDVNWETESSKRLRTINGGHFCSTQDEDKNKVCFLKKWFGVKYRKRVSKEKKVEERVSRNLQKQYGNINREKFDGVANKGLFYYVFQPNGMGMRNYDVFIKEDPEKLITVRIKINKPITNNTVLKLAFVDQRSVISPTKQTEKYFIFEGVLKESSAWVIGLKTKGKADPFLGISKIKTSKKEVLLELESVPSFEELAVRLEEINVQR